MLIFCQNNYRSRSLKSRNKTDDLRTYIWLRAAIYLVNSLVKKTGFRLIAEALKCAGTVFSLIIFASLGNLITHTINRIVISTKSTSNSGTYKYYLFVFDILGKKMKMKKSNTFASIRLRAITKSTSKSFSPLSVSSRTSISFGTVLLRVKYSINLQTIVIWQNFWWKHKFGCVIVTVTKPIIITSQILWLTK